MWYSKKKATVLLLARVLLALVFVVVSLSAAVSAAAIVSPDGWGWQNPFPQGNGLLGAWGSSLSDVFAVGYGGTVLHYNGSAWGPMASGTTNQLLGVWGSSPSDVFAVGNWGTILHYPDLEQQAPTITSVSPDEGNHGETLDVTITGTNFTGATAVSFGSGITVNRFMVNSSSQITANIAISSSAMIGSSDVSVTSPGGTATKTGGFAVNQVSFTITSVSPNLGNQGETLDVTITGTNFTGVTAVSFGSGITVNSLAVNGSNRIAADIIISSSATPGARDVSVTTIGGTATKTGSFTVNQVSFTITSVSPNQSNQGETLDVTITGSNFIGATAVSFGSGTTVNSFTVNSSDQISANITISSSATPGVRDVSVTTPGVTAVKTDGFTVGESKKGLPLWIWIAIGVGAVVVLVVSALVVRRATRRRA